LIPAGTGLHEYSKVGVKSHDAIPASVSDSVPA